MRIRLYADVPNHRELSEVISALRDGQVIIYPTSTGYAYACDALQTRAVESIYRIKKLNPKKKALSLMFRDISQASEYCKINDRAFRFIKEHQGEYTFILPTASTLPKIFKERKEVGARFVQNPIGRLLLEELGNPLITSSLPLDEENPEYALDPELVEERYGWEVAIVVDGGLLTGSASTVIDCTTEPFELIRLGHGRLDDFEPALAQ